MKIGNLNKETLKALKNDGVMIIDAKNTYIEPTVRIKSGAVIYPMSCIYGNTIIGERSVIYPFCDIVDTIIGDDTEVRSTYSNGAKIGNKCTVGPFACLRKNSVIGNHCRIGDFVEIKNSTLEDGVKSAHLTYVGDSVVGQSTNIGCGVVFANYDGKIKQGVSVGKNVFIGCNSNLVAPLKICDNAYIGAGSTVTKDLPERSLCIARAREYIKDDWRRK